MFLSCVYLFVVKKSRWVRLLPGPPEATEAHQDVVAGAGDFGRGLVEVIDAFPGLQDVRDGHGVVRGADDALGRIRRLIRSGGT